MAHMMKAIQAYSPRVTISRMVQINEIVNYIADRTGLNTGTILYVMMELRDSLLTYTGMGYSVKLPGLGSYAPTIDKEGTFGINHTSDKRLLQKLNAPDRFTGDIRNKDMIGKSIDDFIERWNEEHPKDKVKKRADLTDLDDLGTGK